MKLSVGGKNGTNNNVKGEMRWPMNREEMNRKRHEQRAMKKVQPDNLNDIINATSSTLAADATRPGGLVSDQTPMNQQIPGTPLIKTCCIGCSIYLFMCFV